MSVTMMNVREMRMRMLKRLVCMLVGMRFARVNSCFVVVPVGQRFVKVKMFVFLAQMQPHANSHEECRAPKERAHRFA